MLSTITKNVLNVANSADPDDTPRFPGKPRPLVMPGNAYLRYWPAFACAAISRDISSI